MAASAVARFEQPSAQAPRQLSLNVGERHVDLAHQRLMPMRPGAKRGNDGRMLEQSGATLRDRLVAVHELQEPAQILCVNVFRAP
nr:hypothetical protein [uncultured Steroidobacter sp.]